MTLERALEILDRMVVRSNIARGVAAAVISEEDLAAQTIRSALGVLPAVAAIYHEGIERLGGHCDVRN